MLYSTKADEFAAVNDLREQGFTVQEAVQQRGFKAKKRTNALETKILIERYLNMTLLDFFHKRIPPKKKKTFNL